MTNTDLEKILFLDIETVPLVYKYTDLDEPSADLWNKKWQYQKEVPPEQQYAKAGIYTVSLTATNDVGLNATFSAKIDIQT